MARVKYSSDIGTGFGEVRSGEFVDDAGMFLRTRETTMQVVVGEDTFIFPLEGVIDVSAEKARLSKAIEAAENDRNSLKSRLDNPNFTERAKPEAVEKARADHGAKAAEAERLRAALDRLG
jgi:valyl-tRNA synthetase